MKKHYREELNQADQRENERQVEADFQDFVKVGLPTMIALIMILILLFTWLAT